MGSVHISLVGGQASPVIKVIKELQPEHVVLIYSSKTKSQAESIKKEFASWGITFELKLFATEAKDYPDIVKSTRELLESYLDQDVTLNIIGGSKIWSIVFMSEASKHDNMTIFGIDQNDYIVNFTEGNSYLYVEKGSILDLLRVSGEIPSEFTYFRVFTPEDFQVANDFEKFRAECFGKLYEPLMELVNPDSKKATRNLSERIRRNPEGRYETAGGIVEWKQTDLSDTVTITLHSNGKDVVKEFSSPHCKSIVFNAGWFELKVAEMINGWDRVDEILMGVKFMYKSGKTKNEYDVVARVGGKLLFVECKIRYQDNFSVDKFAQSVEYYGGKSSKALFVTGIVADNDFRERCQQCNVLYQNISQKKPSNDGGRKNLYDFLNKEMDKINA